MVSQQQKADSVGCKVDANAQDHGNFNGDFIQLGQDRNSQHLTQLA